LKACRLSTSATTSRRGRSSSELYEGLIDLLEGEYELIIDRFYEKIALFFANFKNSRKSPKHFEDLLKIIVKGISRFRVWKSQMGKLYLVMLIFEQITLLKDYLLYFNISPVTGVVGDYLRENMNICSFVSGRSDPTRVDHGQHQTARLPIR
jgi:hypothetical protein